MPRQATEWRGDFGALRLRASPLSFVGVRRPGRGQPRRAQRKHSRPRGAGDPEREAELETHRSHHAAGGPGQDRRGSESRGKEGSAPKQSGARGPGRGVSRSPPPTVFSPSAPARGPRRTSLVRVMLQKSAQDSPPDRIRLGAPEQPVQRLEGALQERPCGPAETRATAPGWRCQCGGHGPTQPVNDGNPAALQRGDESFRRLCW